MNATHQRRRDDERTSVVRMTPPPVRYRRRVGDPLLGSPPLTAGARPSDRLLLRAVALGDETAWHRLVNAYLPLVWSLSLEAAGDRAPAVCELVWLRLAQDPPALDALDLEVWLRLAVVQAERTVPPPGSVPTQRQADA